MQSSWLPIRIPKPDARARCFCFPYAGGSASVFHPWVQEFQSSKLEIRPVQLPGREQRLREQPGTSILEVAETAAREILPLLDVPFYFFGHSLGSVIAFETVRALRRFRLALPVKLFVSSGHAPQRPRDEAPLRHLPPDQFLTAVGRRYQGIPPDVANYPELLEIFLPILRGDLKLLETYVYRVEAPLACPITAFCGDSDSLITAQQLGEWSAQTTRSFQQHMFQGGHFYLRESRNELLAFMRREWQAHL